MTKIIDNIVFILFIISASAMSSDNKAVPGAICLLSIAFLHIRSKKGEGKWRNVILVEETASMGH